MNALWVRRIAAFSCAAMSLTCAVARADVITEWNVKAGEIVVNARLGAPPATRVMAVLQTAVYDAVNAITRRYPAGESRLEATPGASVDAAVAAANRVVLAKLVAPHHAAIDSAYQAALAKIADGAEKAAGIAVGEKAAAAMLAARADDGAAAGESYRPRATPGTYVPTAVPVTPQWPQRRPWLMKTAAQFRPGPPPGLASETWASDYNEIKAVGSKTSAVRSSEQTDIARFWEATLPPIYHGIVRSVANAPGREVTRNARLFAAVAQASDDALIAVFEAKYHYHFWRPITAIRNGDLDGHDATERDASWTPFIDTPMHPEYPCAHCIVAGSVGAVLQADIGADPMPTLTTTSPTANGAARSWKSVDDFVSEVALARIYDGVHYRFSTTAGTAMGRQVGALAVTKFMRGGPAAQGPGEDERDQRSGQTARR